MLAIEAVNRTHVQRIAVVESPATVSRTTLEETVESPSSRYLVSSDVTISIQTVNIRWTPGNSSATRHRPSCYALLKDVYGPQHQQEQ